MPRIRHRATVAAFIAAGWLIEGGTSPYEEFAPRELASCTDDINAYCSTTRTGGGRIVRCLRDNQSRIAADCKAAITPSDYPGTTNGVAITVTIDGIRTTKGSVVVMLNDDPHGFPAGGKRTIIAPVKNNTLVVTYRNLKPATYAVSAFHDENDNGKFDSGFFSGTEGFGASNGGAGPPDFATSAVKVVGNTSLTVSMRYP